MNGKLGLLDSSAPSVVSERWIGERIDERGKGRQPYEERARLEMLSGDFSGRFADLPPALVDGQVEHALRQIVGHLGVDRIALGELCARTGKLLVTHQYTVPGIPPVRRVVVDGALPWLTQMLRRGEVVQVAQVDLVSSETECEREAAAGIPLNLLIPLSVSGSFTSVLVLGAFYSSPDWPEEQISRLRFVGEILANAVSRKRASEERGEPLRFERLLSELSRRFVDLAPGAVDASLGDGLKAVAESLGADRCILFDYLPDRAEFHPRHSWASEGIESVGVVETAWFPHVTAALLRGECIVFRSLEDLPEEAATDREQFARNGIRSFIGVPLTVGGATVGSISLTSWRQECEWPDSLPQRLWLLGEVFANAIERQRGQEELQRLRDELAHVARIVTMGAISTSIAHEVNQPLCAILSNAQSTARLLSNKRTRKRVLHEALEDIATDARRASDVVARIRALGKRSALDCQPLHLNDVTRQVLPLVRDDLMRKGISLELALAEALPPVQGDRVQLQQVILNLIVNGAEALERVDEGTRRLTLRTSAGADGMVALQVEDSGPGLDESSIDRVFEAFFTTKPQGMGLGLAISRSIILAHHGRLWANRNAGPGTTFHIALPAMQEEPT